MLFNLGTPQIPVARLAAPLFAVAEGTALALALTVGVGGVGVGLATSDAVSAVTTGTEAVGGVDDGTSCTAAGPSFASPRHAASLTPSAAAIAVSHTRRGRIEKA
jgi:hypothetical protein